MEICSVWTCAVSVVRDASQAQSNSCSRDRTRLSLRPRGVPADRPAQADSAAESGSRGVVPGVLKAVDCAWSTQDPVGPGCGKMTYDELSCGFCQYGRLPLPRIVRENQTGPVRGAKMAGVPVGKGPITLYKHRKKLLSPVTLLWCLRGERVPQRHRFFSRTHQGTGLCGPVAKQEGYW